MKYSIYELLTLIFRIVMTLAIITSFAYGFPYVDEGVREVSNLSLAFNGLLLLTSLYLFHYLEKRVKGE